MHIRQCTLVFALLLSLASAGELLRAAPGETPVGGETNESGQLESGYRSTYVLGVGDQITIWALAAEEISDKAIQIGPSGHINIPLVGRLKATGMTIEELEAELSERLGLYIKDPQVSVTVTMYSSKPVSVIGAVKNPGVHQVQRPMTLVEALSMAGGLAENAGPKVKITRRLESGPLPLPGVIPDSTGAFNVAEVDVSEILDASSPERNILVRPNDVISVPNAETVYVMGAVNKPGAFMLGDRNGISVLGALSLAGGVDNNTASAKNARVLRLSPDRSGRAEIAINIKDLLRGETKDLDLEPEDILFVPDSKTKKITATLLESAIRIGTYATYRIGF